MLRSPAIRIASWIVLFLLAGTMIVPLWSVLATSFTTKYASLQPGIQLWPEPFSLEGYQTLFNRLNFLLPFYNTMLVTVFGTAIHVLLAGFGGYVLAQQDLPFRRLIAGIIVVTLTIPSHVILVPLFVVFKQLGLLNTLFSLLLSGTVSAFSILLMKGYFEQVPRPLVESAQLDGATTFDILRYVYVPLALPGIVTVAAFQIVYRYNMFIEPLLYINDPKLATLQLALKSIIISEGSTSTNDYIAPNVMMAGIIIALIPLLVFYPIMQRFLLRGLTVGGVKE